jgi:hypothetical protein
MPAVEKLRIQLDAASIFLDCVCEVTDGEIAIRVVEGFLERFQLADLPSC